jgi:hypothetical protein
MAIDPSKDCISWYSGAVVNARDFHGDTLRVGVEYYNFPPAGEVAGADYILTGYISGSNGSFTLTVNLETAVTREIAASQTAGYGYDPTSQQTAGENIASALMPLLQTIRIFEVNKRNAYTSVAIRDMHTLAQEITVTPNKTKLNTGESVEVDIEMIDCDGVPLGDREITFEALPNDSILMIPGTTGGTVEPSTVTTDAEGKATVTFTAGNTAGAAQIVAAYRHEKPCGRLSAFIGTAEIIIGQPTTPFWKVCAVIKERYERRVDTTMIYPAGFETHFVSEKREGSAKLNLLFENDADSSNFYFVAYEEYGDPFGIAVVSGNWTYNYYKHFYGQAGSLPPDIEFEIKNQSGSAYFGSGITGFEFHYPNNPSDVAIVAQAGGIGWGSSLNRSTTLIPDYHWVEYSYTYSSTMGVYTEFNADQCSIIKSGMSYLVSGSRTGVYPNGEGTETRTVNLAASISMIDEPTGVGQLEKPIPEIFSLNQNYPNPFNPTTNITYSVGTNGRVSLKVFDLLGREVATLVNEFKSPGKYTITWNALNLASGIYFYKLESAGKVQIKKSILIK